MTPQKLPIPLPSRLYYGWVIVAIAWSTTLVASTTNILVFSMFIDPIKEDLNIRLSALAWAMSIRMVTGAVSSPLIGRLVDVFGARWLGLFGGAVAAATMMGMYFVGNIWEVYVLFAIGGATGFGAIGGNLLTIVPVANWFVAKRGRATSIAATGGMVGTASAVPMALFLINTVGWRWAYVVFGMAILVIIVPAYGLLMRRRPEDLGLLPDGALRQTDSMTPSAGAGSRTPLLEVDWTLGQAMRNPVLWLILMAFTMQTMATSAILFLRVPFWNDLGVSPQVIAVSVAADPFTVGITMLVFGFLAERYPVRFMAVVGGIWRGIATIPLFMEGKSVFALLFHNITWGIGSGGFAAVRNLIFPDYYGRQAQGAIRGVTAPVMVGAGALGAPIVGYIIDAGIDIVIVWQISLGLMLLAGFTFFFLKPPQLPQDRAAPPAESAPERVRP